MNVINQLERRFPWFAIPGLIRFVALFNALVFLLHLAVPGFETMLSLNREAILQGEVWRLVTWIFIPETFQPFWIFFELLFVWFLGDGLEQTIGAFKTTLFYLSGVFLCTLIALLFGSYGANTLLNLSLLYAFATLHPDYKVLLFFIIPIRIGWMALLSCFFVILRVFMEPLAAQAAFVVTLLNYLFFFGPVLLLNYRARKDAPHKQRFPLLKKKKEEPLPSLHHCAFCHSTEQSHPDLFFRVAADGEEYCIAHLPSKDKALF